MMMMMMMSTSSQVSSQKCKCHRHTQTVINNKYTKQSKRTKGGMKIFMMATDGYIQISVKNEITCRLWTAVKFVGYCGE